MGVLLRPPTYAGRLLGGDLQDDAQYITGKYIGSEGPQIANEAADRILSGDVISIPVADDDVTPFREAYSEALADRDLQLGAGASDARDNGAAVANGSAHEANEPVADHPREADDDSATLVNASVDADDATLASGQDVANLDELHGMWQDSYAEAVSGAWDAWDE